MGGGPAVTLPGQAPPLIGVGCKRSAFGGRTLRDAPLLRVRVHLANIASPRTLIWGPGQCEEI